MSWPLGGGEDVVIRADDSPLSCLLQKQFTHVVVHQIRDHHGAGAVVFGAALYNALSQH